MSFPEDNVINLLEDNIINFIDKFINIVEE
jgi:hypothetical protein